MRMPVKKLTLTFKDQYINDYIGNIILSNRLKRYKHKFNKALFYPELGETTNYHFHGIIEYKHENENYYKSFIGGWTRYVGHIKISDPKGKFSSKKPYHLVEWLYYCKKDQWLWNNKRIDKNNLKHTTKSKIFCNKCNCVNKEHHRKSIFDWWAMP